MQQSPSQTNRRLSSASSPHIGGSHVYELVVHPIVKTAISQRDTSGETLDNFAVNGSSFNGILQKIWEKFSDRFKGRAVKSQEEWTVVVPDMSDWSKLMQFKFNNHIVDCTKSEQAWRKWLHDVRGKTVKLYLYEYGISITTLPILATFKNACIVPTETDRSGATAESSLQEIVDRLQQRWESTFQCAAVGWRMWANHLTRNLNRSTWDAAIEQPPPDSVARQKPQQLQQHISNATRSADLALDAVAASKAVNRQLRQDWEAFGRRLDAFDEVLATRESVINAFMRDVLPPRDVIDPLERVENIRDVDHE
ncbi:hypothetical protein PHMEG_00033686 [Phytophthora megakarya]|uniref:Uncharacterized protein n=1 Tax=Phytophthora megakarya TaxID=4795 RepID=A0A225UTC9_9STRA|nr:hypothetical protein PHMEG_00033686 [Phytophthora megakarya]